MTRVAVYTVCFNEELFLPYFLRHYRRYADRITLFDNHSTDRSAEIARQAGAVVRPHDSGDEFRDDLLLQVKNNCWKECRGQGVDWVVVVDVDEILYHPDLRGFLRRSREEGVTVCTATGFNMVSDRPPTTAGQVYEEITRGVPAPRYSKMAVFNPDAIRAQMVTLYGGSCHSATWG